MRSHRLPPEELIKYRQRLTHGCYACMWMGRDKQAFCKIEKVQKIRLGFPNATKEDCKEWRLSSPSRK